MSNGRIRNRTEEHRLNGGVFSYLDEEGNARISAPAETHRVLSDAQIEAGKQAKEAEKWRNGRQKDFTASNMRNLHEVYEALTTSQCGYLMRLQCNVEYESGRLINADRTSMTNAEIRRTLGLDRKRSTYYDFMDACKANGIIAEVDGYFLVNQRYHFRGAFSDQYVVKSYTAKVKQVYREVKAADIGLIYRMLPFVHYETNALCTNPFEKDPEHIRWFNRKELAEAIGVNPATLGRRLPEMTFGAEYVIARVKVGKGAERYTFNPKVFYRRNRKPDDTLLAMFNVDK